MPSAQSLDDRNCLVVWVLHTKDDLGWATIVLTAERSDVFCQARRYAVQRFKDRHPRGGSARGRRARADEAMGQERRQDELAATDNRKQPDDDRQPIEHDRTSQRRSV